MNLQSYINLYQLLQERASSHEQNRAFGLAHAGVTPVRQLLLWQKSHLSMLKKPLLSEQLSSYLYGISLVLGIVALLLGLFSGIALLSYNGHAPVNMVYFMAMAVFFPLFTMLLSLLSMLRAGRARSVLIHLSPAYWMEKVTGLLSGRTQVRLESLRINPLLLNWLVIQRSQMLALLFSVGLLLALLGSVATRDIAFAWSTTLQVTPERFHHFLSALALPWRELCPSAVPSVTLVEQSQYFRLGETLDSGMIKDAAKLGEWWKFLACATLFYAIILRLLMWIASSFGLKRALKRAIMNLEGTSQLLYEMNTPLVSSTAETEESPFVQGKGGYRRLLSNPAKHYSVTLGWALEERDILLLHDSLGIGSDAHFAIGGSHTLEEDHAVLSRCHGEVLLYVKAWEPPIMDLMDSLEMLAGVAERITLLPIGTAADDYCPADREYRIWERKIEMLDHPKVWLCRIS